MEIYRRYVLEPRRSHSSWGNSNKCWLAVYDTQLEKYLEEDENSHHKYMRFKSSKEAFDYLLTL